MSAEKVEKIYDMLLTYRREEVCQIVYVIGISYGSVISILNDQLGLRKLSARWVFSIGHIRKRLTTSKSC